MKSAFAALSKDYGGLTARVRALVHNPEFPVGRQTGRFCGDIRPFISRTLVSLCALAPFERGFLASRLRIQKFRSRRPGSGTNSGRIRSRNCDFRASVIRDFGDGIGVIPD